MRRAGRLALRVAGVAAALLVLGGAVAALYLRHGLFRPVGVPGREVAATFAPGTSAAEILRRLEERGVLADATLARLYLVHRLGDPSLKAGEYRFPGGETAPQVLDRLIRGEIVSHPVTVPEGLTLEETAAHLAERGFGDSGALLAAMRDPSLVARLDPEAVDLEGYLFPDTYHFARATEAAAVVRTMVEAFLATWEDEVSPFLPTPSERTVREVVTLASIVEKEARLDDERPVIAGVYSNRLRRGIALYADPTIIFALKREGRWDGDLRKADLEMDSPFNTYRVAGLPPSPICSPGAAALRAAAAPADVPYLYFVSRNDGSHVFAETLAEHNRNVHRWQRLYWQRKRAEEKERAESDPSG